MSMFRSYKDCQRIPSKSNYSEAVVYNCDICEEGAWTSETEVDIHKKIIHGKELREVMTNKDKFGCLVCAKQHENKNSLLEHFKTEHLISSKNARRVEREIFICDVCTRVFFNKMLLALHIIQKHSTHRKNINVECPKCSKMLKKGTLWTHLEQHHVSSVSTCPICVEKCINRKELRKHLDTHRKYLFCELCTYTTKSQDNFHKHLNMHKSLNKTAELKVKKYFVPTRNTLKYAPKLIIQNPMKGLLLPYNIHICIICRHICMSISEMKRHLIFDHTLKKETKKCYMCSCGQQFPNMILLKQHTFKEFHQVSGESDASAARQAVIEVVVTVPQAVDEVEISDSDTEIVDT